MSIRSGASLSRRGRVQAASGAQALLSSAALYLEAANHDGTQTFANRGSGGTALNGTMGSSGSSDSNDPAFLAFDGSPYLYLPGIGANAPTVPDEAAFAVTNLDVRVRVALDDYTPASNQVLWSQADNTPNFGWELRWITTGRPQWRFTADGTTILSPQASASPALVDGVAYWIRAVLIPNNGSGGYTAEFYWAADQVDEPTSWTMIGTSVITAGATTLFNSTSVVRLGATTGNVVSASGKFFRAILKNGVAGSTVLDINCAALSSGSATSFLAAGGQTVTLNRAASGRKTVAVVAPVLLFGTDDYIEVADNNLLDFGASDSFTVLAVTRQWATVGDFRGIVSKQAVAAGPSRWAVLSGSGGFHQTYISLTDAATATDNSASTTLISANGALTVRGHVADRATGTLYNTLGATLSATTVLDTGAYENSSPVTIGRLQNAGNYIDMEFMAAAVFRRALTQAEITILTNYFQGRYR